MSEIQYGLLHCHTEFSVRDSAMKVSRLIARAKKLGAPAVALTDHGILTGIFDFIDEAKKNNIKPILGVEAYFYPGTGEEKTSRPKRQHLILMAKDEIGYKAICRIMTDSYKYICDDNPNIPFAKDSSYPITDFAILKRHIGPGTSAHGHVIATSACMNGVLATILRENELLAEETEKLYVKRDKYRAVDDDFLDMQKKSEDLKAEVEKLIQDRDEATEQSKFNLNGLTRRLKTLTEGTEEYIEVAKELDEKAKAKEDAKERLTRLKLAVANKRREKTEHDKKLKTVQAQVDKWLAENEKIEAIMKNSIDEAALRQMAVDACKKFMGIFGADNFYIELQYHGIASEAKVMPVLADIAKELNVPVVAANDAHYATNSKEDIRARTIVSAMRFGQEIDPSVEKDEGYGEMYIKSDEELKTSLLKILDADIVDKAMSGIGNIVDQCNAELAFAEHYPKFVGGIPGESAADRLRRLATEGIPKRYPKDKWTKELENRMNYELGVINGQGYSDYLCIVQDFLAYGRSLAKECPEKVGYTIGPGRGSAVGSIVCYLSGITSVDPIKYNLLFERFLNTERVSMPDIDSDFETSIRAKVIDYCKEKYGDGAICNIITKGSEAGKGAIRDTGRVTGIPLSVVDEVARLIPSTPNATISDAEELTAYCAGNPVAAKLVEDAKLIEGTVVNYGMHAAGVIISDNGDVGEYVPLMYNSAKGQWVAQCDMGQCEFKAGLLKMDFLGLRNLDIITDTLRRIKRNTGASIDIEAVPLEPVVFREIFAKGLTNSVFQFESGGMKSMLKRFKPDSMEDIILLVAAYRPGPMQYLDKIIASKQGIEKPVYIAEGLEDILAPTYGYTIYQEQVMQIFNKVAGFSLGEADVVRRAMGKKKIKILLDPETNYHGRFIDGMKKAGATEEDAEKFWNELLDFASYAFNKSHAAAYAFVAYYTAWLKYHYPAEYMCSVMARTDYAKIPMLLNDCRELGLTIKQPDLNSSSEDFSNIGDTILFGFNNIKGVGNAGDAIVYERSKNGKFTSIKDVIYRMIPNKNDDHTTSISETAYRTLIEAGAFDQFCGGNRLSLLNGLGEFITDTKKLKAKRIELEKKQNDFAAAFPEGTDSTDKEYKKALRSVNTCQNAVDRLNADFASKMFLPVEEDIDAKLSRERELLGFYLSGSPIEKYREAIEKIPGVTKIVDLGDGGNAIICGIVDECKELKRKSDGAPFGIFTLMDSTTDIEVKCFTKEYRKYSDIIAPGEPLCITGKIYIDNRDDEGEKSITVISMKRIETLNKRKILITGASIADWVNGLNEAILEYRDDKGCECFLYDSITSETRKVTFRVSPEITNAKIDNVLISNF